MSYIKIFGYGSLINKQSLLATSPDATDILAARVEGFKRSFNVWDAQGLTAKTHGPLRGQTYCALDLQESEGSNANGVVFTINQSLENIKSREHMYRLVETEAFDFENNASIGKVLVFSAGLNNGSYDMDSLGQTRYLGMCLAGAKDWGQKFYDEFLATTHIDDRPLSDFPQLLSAGQNYIENLAQTP